MKKVIGFALAVAMLVMMCFSVSSVCMAEETTVPDDLLIATDSTTAPDDLLIASNEVKIDLMEYMPKAAMWSTKPGGEGTMTVADAEDGFVFTADKGWPEAYCDWTNSMGDTTIGAKGEGLYLHCSFTCTGGANILFFFNGQNPSEQDATGKNSVSVNYLYDAKNKSADGSITDLPAGSYDMIIPMENITKEISLTDSGEIRFSGIKVFSVGEKATLTLTKAYISPESGASTTTKAVVTTKATGTTAKNAKTGWTDDLALYAIIAACSGAVIAVMVLTGKKAKAK